VSGRSEIKRVVQVGGQALSDLGQSIRTITIPRAVRARGAADLQQRIPPRADVVADKLGGFHGLLEVLARLIL
jgi:hypothetical protein